MKKLIHPESFEQYRYAIEFGSAGPSVYHSLVEAAVRAGTIPERIAVAWCLRDSLWEAVSVLAAGLVLMGFWWLGIALWVVATWASLRHTAPLNVRLGYCAVIDPVFGEWAFQRGHLSLVAVPDANRAQWQRVIRSHLEQASLDSFGSVSRWQSILSVVFSVTLLCAKTVTAVLLLRAAWATPSWASIGVGVPVAVFFLLQSLQRTAMLLRGATRKR